MVVSLMVGLTACGDDKNDSSVTINLRSCSIADGAEFNAPDLNSCHCKAGIRYSYL